ncbi:MAG: hypothetical protein ABL878_00330 [Burkholderiales bacterium]
MENPVSTTPSTTPDPSVVTIAHVVYGLHALSILIGLTSFATIVGAFVFGVPSIIAVILNYLHQPKARDTYLASHFRWQIRTFWFAVLWVFFALALFVTIIGIPLAWAVLVGAGIWIIYRVARGWLALSERKAMVI